MVLETDNLVPLFEQNITCNTLAEFEVWYSHKGLCQFKIIIDVSIVRLLPFLGMKYKRMLIIYISNIVYTLFI